MVTKMDFSTLEDVHISLYGVNSRVREILSTRTVKDKSNKVSWLLKAISVIDLTTLAGDDCRSNVVRLCHKAANPLSEQLSASLGLHPDAPLRTAAVCVYPARVSDAASAIVALDLVRELRIAAVATGFPSGQYCLETRLQEITLAVAFGASEIDVVVDRSLVLREDWHALFSELSQMRTACGDAHLKVILAIGELGTMTNIYKASMVAMYAGADFIKTSTGKESVNATLPVGLVMCRAIRQFYSETGRKIGLKPAGGIRTCEDAISWLILVKEELGEEWLQPSLFRIGASGLLGDIEKWLYEYVYHTKTSTNKFAFI